MHVKMEGFPLKRGLLNRRLISISDRWNSSQKQNSLFRFLYIGDLEIFGRSPCKPHLYLQLIVFNYLYKNEKDGEAKSYLEEF